VISHEALQAQFVKNFTSSENLGANRFLAFRTGRHFFVFRRVKQGQKSLPPRQWLQKIGVQRSGVLMLD